MSPLMEKMIRAVVEQSPPACKMDRLCAENAVTAALSVLRNPDVETVEDMQMAFQETNDSPCSEEAVRAALATLAAHLTGETKP